MMDMISGEGIAEGVATIACAPGAAPKRAFPYTPAKKGLTSTQLQLLLDAAARKDGVIVFPQRLRGRIVRQIAASMLDRGLVKEVAARVGVKAWRNEADGAFVLALSPMGRKAVRDFNRTQPLSGSSNVAPEQPSSPARGEGQLTKTRNYRSARDASAGQEAHGASPREGTKIARVLGLLQRPQGATMNDLVRETSWLVHTTRAALTGLRKRGHVVEMMRGKDGTVWRVGRIEPRDA